MGLCPRVLFPVHCFLLIAIRMTIYVFETSLCFILTSTWSILKQYIEIQIHIAFMSTNQNRPQRNNMATDLESNQEAATSKIMNENEWDFSLDLTEAADQLNTIEKLSSEKRVFLDSMHKIMEQRQELAKKKESIVYAQNSNYLPGWVTFKAECDVKLKNESDEMDIKKCITDVTTEIRNQWFSDIVAGIRELIDTKQQEINEVRRSVVARLSDKNAVDSIMETIKKWNTGYSEDLDSFRQSLVVNKKRNDAHNDRPRRGASSSGRGRRPYQNYRGQRPTHPYSRK